MALNDYKITNNERDSLHVQSAPDVLSKDAQENKKVFDNLVEYFIGKYNNLVDAVDGNYIEADDVGAGLDVDPLRWKYAIYKGDMIANFSGSITQTPTGYRTTIASVSGLSNDDFMDCLVEVNGEQYQCEDSVETATGYMTTFEVNDETITVTYVGSDIIFEHENNPLETTYWNVQMFRTDAEKIPTKSLPPNVTIKGVVANTLPPSSQATASWENEVITLGIPKGDKGDKGDTGTAGVSIVSVTRYYLATNIGAGVTRETSGWTETIQTMTSVNQYLWSYETVTGSNGLVISTTDPVIIGRWGQNGADGISITEVYEYFAISNDNQYPPAEWSETPILPTASNKYLWNYSSIVYSDSSVQDTSAKVIGTYSRDGSDAAYLAFSQPPILRRVHGTQIRPGSVMMKFAAYKNGERIPCVGTSYASASDYTVTTVNATTTADGTITIAWSSGFDPGSGESQAFLYTFQFDGITVNHWMEVNKVYDGAKGDKGDPGEVTLDQLLENTTVQTNENNTPYLFRPTPQCGDIEFLDKVVGGTLAVNQLANIHVIDVSKTENGVTITDNRDGTYTVYTDAGGATGNVYIALPAVQVTAGHRYYFRSLTTAGNTNTYYAYVTTNVVQPYDYGTPTIGYASTSGNAYIVPIYVKTGTVITTPITVKPQYIDLTQMLPSTIADYVYNLEQGNTGAGVAWLKQYYPSIFNTYQPFNAGTLESVEASAHVMTGFNQWDEETADGYWDGNTGEWTASGSWKSCKNYIPCVPNTAYFFNMGTVTTGSLGRVCYYDNDKNFISSISGWGNAVVTTPNNARYMTFYANPNYFANDICINISSSRNGEYEPYVSHSYPLDSSLTLRGIPKLDNGVPYYDGDEYESDGTVTRKYGVVDLGTLTWTYVGGNYATFATTGVNALIKSDVSSTTTLCAKYKSVSQNNASSSDDNYIWVNASGLVSLKDTSKSSLTVDQFKAAMSGVYLIYELATPTTETADTYGRVQDCYKGGTEEFVPVERESGTSIVPVGHTTYYPLTLKDTMPTSNGTYTLSLTVTDGKPTLSWS